MKPGSGEGGGYGGLTGFFEAGRLPPLQIAAGGVGVVVIIVVIVIAAVVVLAAQIIPKVRLVQHGAQNGGPGLLQLFLHIHQLLLTHGVIVHRQQDAVAMGGNLGGVNQHAGGGHIHDDIVHQLGHLVEEQGKAGGTDQGQGVGDGLARGNDEEVVDIGGVNDVLQLRQARQIVGSTPGGNVPEAQVVPGDGGFTQIHVHQGHLVAQFGHGIGNVQGQEGLALGSVAAGNHNLFDILAGEGQIGAQGVDGLVAGIAELGQVFDGDGVHLLSPPLPDDFLPELWVFFLLSAAADSSSLGTMARFTRPVYRRISSVVLILSSSSI